MEIQENKYYVYFLKECIPNPNFKIGYSKNPIVRQKHLQTGHPIKLGLFGLLEYDRKEDAQQMEKELHNTFKKYKIKGEWFTWNNEIKQIMQYGQDYYSNYIRFFT